VKRRFRLRRSIDIKRVRRSGKSYAHPLIVLYSLVAQHPGTHVAVMAGVATGNAVRRNRSKRLLRAAMSDLMPQILPGHDLILVARTPLADAGFEKARTALASLLQRAGLLTYTYDDRISSQRIPE